MPTNSPLNENSPAVMTHLTILSGLIQRMSENRRSCKLWCVTLVSAILALAIQNQEAQDAVIALMPTGILWLLDSYYLGLERRFRDSYSKFIGKVHRSDVRTTDLYDVAPTGSEIKRFFWSKYVVGQFLWSLFCSMSSVLFYFPLGAAVLVARKLLL